MTLKELSNLQYLDTLKRVTTNRLLDLEEKLDTGAQVLDGMPKQPGAKDQIGNTVPEIVDLRARLAWKIKEYEDEKLRILAYIDNVDDYHVRLILTLRFVEFKTWGEVAEAVGGGNTESSVKMTCYRHFE